MSLYELLTEKRFIMQNFSSMYLLNLALKRIWVLILAAIVFGAGAFSYCKLIMTPTYKASSAILITNGRVSAMYGDDDNSTYYKGESDDGYVSGSDLSSSISLTYTVIELLKTPDAYVELADALGGDYQYNSLKGRTTIEMRERTPILDISFVSTDGKEAEKIANEFAKLACKYIPDCIPYSKAKVITTARSHSLVSPRTFMTTLVSMIVGAILAFAVVFIIDFSDQSIRGEDELIERYDVAFLGSIPDFEGVTSATDSIYKRTKRSGYYGYR